MLVNWRIKPCNVCLRYKLENYRGNPEWTIQRHIQHWIQDTERPRKNKQ